MLTDIRKDIFKRYRLGKAEVLDFLAFVCSVNRLIPLMVELECNKIYI